MVRLLLESASRCSAREARQQVPDGPGFYAIFADEADALRPPFAKILRDRRDDLLYVGIAKVSLLERLVKQELQLSKPATFFRSIGAALGFKSPAGSLVGKKNRNNYGFSPLDKAALIDWAENHIFVRWVCTSGPSKEDETEAIARLRPLLNIDRNPAALPELEKLRGQCRDIAGRGRIASDDAVEEAYSAKLRELGDKLLGVQERNSRHEQSVSLRDEYEQAIDSKGSEELLRYAERIRQI